MLALHLESARISVTAAMAVPASDLLDQLIVTPEGLFGTRQDHYIGPSRTFSELELGVAAPVLGDACVQVLVEQVDAPETRNDVAELVALMAARS
jgi:hypothetical protein